MWGLLKKTLDIRIIPWLVFVANLGNAIFWIGYGLPQLFDKTQVWLVNFVGLFLNIIYFQIYLVFLVKKKVFLSIVLCILVAVVNCGLTFIFYWFVDYNINGKIAMAFNILMYAAPSQRIFNLFKTGNCKVIPIEITIIALLNSSCWLLYGLLSNMDWDIIVPNLLGKYN